MRLAKIGKWHEILIIIINCGGIDRLIAGSNIRMLPDARSGAARTQSLHLLVNGWWCKQEGLCAESGCRDYQETERGEKGESERAERRGDSDWDTSLQVQSIQLTWIWSPRWPHWRLILVQEKTERGQSMLRLQESHLIPRAVKMIPPQKRATRIYRFNNGFKKTPVILV